MMKCISAEQVYVSALEREPGLVRTRLVRMIGNRFGRRNIT